jgi:molecular chaperone DnaK
VSARNQADAMIHAVTKSMADAGDKITAEEKTQTETVIQQLKEVMKSDDKSLIEEKTKALTDASAKFAERMYAGQQEGGAAEGQASSDSAQEETAQAKPEENVVDAEFEEIKDKGDKDK